MLVHTVTFKDVEGNEVQRTLHFNLSEDEMTALHLEHMDDGGFILWFQKLQERAVTGYKDAYDELRELIVLAFGERDAEDLTVFDKSEEVHTRFRKNLSRTAMINDLLKSPILFGQFFKQVFPIEMLNMEEIDKAIAAAQEEIAKETAALEASAIEVTPSNATASEPSQNG